MQKVSEDRPDSKKKQKEKTADPPMCVPVYAKRDSKNKIDRRRRCFECKKVKSVVECSACNVALCIGEREDGESCIMRLN